MPKSPMTAQEYLNIERKAEFKSEFYNGEMFAMSGGSRSHSRLAVRLTGLLERHLESRSCEVYNSDLRLYVEACDLYTYPDVSIVCGEPKLLDSHSDVLLNPILLVEVLSPSTEQYDRGTKAKLYRTIPSLREILLVAQNSAEIELYRREADDKWSILTAKGTEATLELASIGYTLPLADLYRGIL